MTSGTSSDAGARPSSPSFALELLGIEKSYGANRVLHGLDFRVRPGSIHALLGANGAGKSTLLKIAVGATQPTGGRILVGGEERHFASTFDAREAGIGMVFQERSLVPQLSAVDNIFLASEHKRVGFVDAAAERREARRIFEQLGVRIPPSALVEQLGIADQQMVEIGKALRLASAVLILDEPTAALTEREVNRLFTVIRQIARSGVGIVYVSHRLAEVFALCDEVTVIRDGHVVHSRAVAATNMREIVEAIAGGAVEERLPGAPDKTPAPSENGQHLLQVRTLSVASKLRDISFNLRRNEILGVAGLAGSGRSTLLKSLFGIVPRASGELRVGGKQVSPNSPRSAIRSGFYLIPEDRKLEGLVLSHSVEENLVLSILRRLRAGPLLSTRQVTQAAAQKIARLRIRPADPHRPVELLSGGNQQKVVLGKAFNVEGRVLLLDEPTFGVDVHSRAEIRDQVREFVNAGNGAVWVTSDLQELRDVADRILILTDGGVKDIVPNRPHPLSESEITHLIQHQDRLLPGLPSGSTAAEEIHA